MICYRCREDKAVSEFARDSSGSRGFQAYCKSCRKAYGRAYREHIKVSQHTPRDSKRCPKCGIVKPSGVFFHSWNQRDGLCGWCKECHAAAGRAARLANPRRAHELDRLFYVTPKGQKASMEARRARRARKQQAPGAFTIAEFKALCRTVGDRCMCCNKQMPLVPDHVIALARGGSNDIDNIQPLCGPCNNRKGIQSWDFRVGFEAT